MEEQEKNYKKVHISKNDDFDFDFDIYIPKNYEEQEIERNLLLTFKDGEEREEFMAETLQVPIMSINIQEVDENGNKIDTSKWEQLSKESFFDEQGNKLPYPYGKSGLNLGEQYVNAIKNAYKYLKENHIISEEHEERADIEGYSYNGVIAQRFALLYPQMVRSIICGGAISSIPIPLKELKGEVLNYPTGIADIEKYTGKTPEEIMKLYKDIVQVNYATEQELRYDGNFTKDGKRVKYNENTLSNTPNPETTVSQHDISPDVYGSVIEQMKIFNTDDINERVSNVEQLLLENGIVEKVKIYPDIDHHSTNEQSIYDMKNFFYSLDKIQSENKEIDSEKIKGFEPETRDGEKIKIDTSYQKKREEIYERIRKGEPLEKIIQNMTKGEIEKFFLNGSDKNKVFMKIISPRLIEDVLKRKQTNLDKETVSSIAKQKEVANETENVNEIMSEVENTIENKKENQGPNLE